MRPEISKYVRPIYDVLDDHISVEERPVIKGLCLFKFLLYER